jgi:hypothetical protein
VDLTDEEVARKVRAFTGLKDAALGYAQLVKLMLGIVIPGDVVP